MKGKFYDIIAQRWTKILAFPTDNPDIKTAVNPIILAAYVLIVKNSFKYSPFVIAWI